MIWSDKARRIAINLGGSIRAVAQRRAGAEYLKPAGNDMLLQMWPVSKRVNSSKAPADDPTLIDRI